MGDEGPEDKSAPMGEADGAPTFAPPARVSEGSHCSSFEAYKAMYDRSIKDPNGFWGELARENLAWFRDFKEV
jgi:acetyl-CoA synthetase